MRWCLPETEELGDREAFAEVGSLVQCFSSSLRQLKTPDASFPCSVQVTHVRCCAGHGRAHSNTSAQAGLSSPFHTWISTLPPSHGCKLWKMNL